MPSTPTATSTSLPVIAAPDVSNGPMSQQNSFPPLPKQQLRMVPPTSRKSTGRAVLADVIDAARGHGGDPEIPVDVDLQPVGNMAVRQRMDDGLLAGRRAPHDTQRVGFNPDDRAVGLGDDAVWIDVVEFFQDLGDAVLFDHDDTAGMRLVGLVPVAGIGEIEPPVGPEGQVIRTVEFFAVSLGHQDLDLAVAQRLLDRRRAMLRGDPGPDSRRLRRVDGAVGAEHTSVGSAADEGIGALLLVLGSHTPISLA